MADTTEYFIISFLIIFTTLEILLMGVIGQGQLAIYEQLDITNVEIEETPDTINFISGLSFFFTNPATDGFSRVLYYLLILAPISGVIALLTINTFRGR